MMMDNLSSMKYNLSYNEKNNKSNYEDSNLNLIKSYSNFTSMNSGRDYDARLRPEKSNSSNDFSNLNSNRNEYSHNYNQHQYYTPKNGKRKEVSIYEVSNFDKYSNSYNGNYYSGNNYNNKNKYVNNKYAMFHDDAKHSISSIYNL
jgi:hypothetical protein